MTKSFSIDEDLFPVDLEKYLLKFLSKTSSGTNYWENPPKGPITDRQIGRVVLQIHQLLDILNANGLNLHKLSFLDIGTGNGMIPRLMLALTNIKEAFGSDPFLDGEHKTSWRESNQDSDFSEILDFIQKSLNEDKLLKFENYQTLTNYEVNKYVPRDVHCQINFENLINYKFFQVDAEKLSDLQHQFDILYCKAIEHIHNWESVFSEARLTLSNKGIFIIKHRSFFSYLGAHRYSAVEIPWGHLLLNDKQYEKFVNLHHANRANEMINFMKHGLSNPRRSVHDMIRIAIETGFEMVSVRYESSNHQKYLVEILNKNPSILRKIKKRYKNLGLDEILSGMVHLVFRKI
tara:strand:+ start:251 stop:1294 length:1044 start_codon:yes stop_codon:yes gene_type:complete